MALANLLNMLKYGIAPLTGAITTGEAFGPMGMLVGVLVAIIDEILIHYNNANEHCLTCAMIETALGSIVGAQIQHIMDERLVQYISSMKL